MFAVPRGRAPERGAPGGGAPGLVTKSVGKNPCSFMTPKHLAITSDIGNISENVTFTRMQKNTSKSETYKI